MEENKNKLIPENDVQEAWERIGRMHAAMAYIESDIFAKTEIVYVILGGDLKRLKEIQEGR